jgi:hypothetical protein
MSSGTLWLQSFSRQSVFNRESREGEGFRSWRLISARGTLTYGWEFQPFAIFDDGSNAPPKRVTRTWSGPGLSIMSQTYLIHGGYDLRDRFRKTILSGYSTIHYVHAKWWLLFLMSVIPPALWPFAVRRWRRQRRKTEGCCESCGYNLTANASGICPECGAACKAASPAGVSPAAGD